MRFYLVTAALLAFAPALGSACSTYAFCHCTNADGSINNDATKASCGRFAAAYQNVDGTYQCEAGTASAGIGGVINLFINNCRMREECNKHGAPGDSNCFAKA